MKGATRTINWFLVAAEMILLGILGMLVWRLVFPGSRTASEPAPVSAERLVMPIIQTTPDRMDGITRQVVLDTKIPPERLIIKIIPYTIEQGDSAWSIATQFGLRPESILWANEGLSAAVNSLKAGDTINIPPVDGVVHEAQEGDTLESIAFKHGVEVDDIVGYTGNAFDLSNPILNTGQLVIVPNGIGQSYWADPVPAAVAGGSSPGGYSGPLVYMGMGYFMWPIGGPILLNQDYWEGHPALDINTYFRQPVFASDSGTVIFSGWSDTGYGNLVIIDHGNGYRTYYAHNEALLVSTGQGVVQGQQIAESGSTGNSTGNHLDFRIRATGGLFYNPLDFLP